MEKLQQKIKHKFNDPALLKMALTHRSVGKINNERLEFLGDSVLGVVISKVLYERFSGIDEGDLSRLRSSLVRGKTLAELALDLGLSDFVILGAGELKSGGIKRKSILADTLEAVFGAVFLDADFEVVRVVILEIYQQLLADLDPKNIIKDPKTLLQEYQQKRGFDLPKYHLVKTSGKDHNAVFTVRCEVQNPKINSTKTSTSIKNAEQKCADFLLSELRQK